jgi:hypothetical protein
VEAKKHSVISTVGETALKEAIERGNPGRKLRLGAFYLGNWITDVSQSVDPVAYKRARPHIRVPDIDKLFDKFVHDAPSWIQEPIEKSDTLNELRDQLRVAQARLQKYITDALNAGKDGDLAKAFKEVFRYVGYFKFVAPKEFEEPNASGVPPQIPNRMDPQSYLQTFDQMYDQYYPYAHLDRPEASKDHYDDRLDPDGKPRNGFTGAPLTQGDLYSYLRDDIEIAASVFAYLDAGVPDVLERPSWAEGTFNPDRTEFTDQDGKQQKISDDNVAWNQHLAMFGQALHAVEDFYAHSTFVEHASVAFPPSYKRAQLYESKEILARRLKTWSFGCDDKPWQTLPNDMNVATGYFDTHDFIISLSHLIEEQLGWGRKGLGQRADEVREYEYKKLMRDALDFMSNPKHVLQKSNPKAPDYDAHHANEVGKWLWSQYEEKIGKDIDRLKHGDEETYQYVETFLQSPWFEDVPDEIKESFRKAAKLFGMYKGAKHLYKTLTELGEIIDGPWDWLKKVIGEKGEKILEEIVEQVRAYVLQAFDQHVGSLRVGCHSLLAKDTGTELFYVAGMACAESVHWYIVNTMARHGRGRTLQVCRGTKDEDDKVSTVPVFCTQWLDWLELTEYFLSNPLASVQVTMGEQRVPMSIVHITAKDPHGSIMSPDQLGSGPGNHKPDPKHILEDMYRPNAYQVNSLGDLEAMGNSFTWETIADANFPTKGMKTAQRQNQINKVLAHQPDGAVIVSDHRNYAFRPGYHVIIPNQVVLTPIVTSDLKQQPWWYPVILGDSKQRAPNQEDVDSDPDPQVIKSWYGPDGKRKADAPDYAHRLIPIDHAALLARIKRAKKIQKELEKKYNAS